MEQIVEKLYEQTSKSNVDALELASQKGNIPHAGCTEEHPFVLMRCGGVKVYDDKSNVVVDKSLEPIEKNFNNSNSKERNISDYISGMTDKYAIDLYSSIK